MANWKGSELTVADFKLLYQNLPGETETNQEER
jgi:hypothetical protein